MYTHEQIEQLVADYLRGADREQLDPVLDSCVIAYQELSEDAQVTFKGDAKGVHSHLRVPCFHPALQQRRLGEELSIFLTMLVPKLPSPPADNNTEELYFLASIDLDSYRSEMKETIRIELIDSDAEIRPVPATGSSGEPDPQMQRLSEIIESFNDLFSTIPWQDKDKVRKVVTEEIPSMVAADKAECHEGIRQAERAYRA